MDDSQVLWAYYPFKNRQSCAVTYLDINDPRGGKKWDKYQVTSLYFPEVHTTSYDKAEKLCREIGERPLTDDETRAKLLRNAVLVFSVRHALEERNVSQVKKLYIITSDLKLLRLLAKNRFFTSKESDSCVTADW